jgi:hypothetical protein
MKRYLPLAGAICVLTAIPALAQTTAQHNTRTELAKGADIVIEGCVAAGQKADTYLMATLKEVEAVPVEKMRKRVYWLNSTKHIKDHVGHQIRIAGRVTDLERSEIEIDLGAGPNGGAVAKIEGPGGKEVKTTAVKAGVGPVGTQGQLDADVPTELVKIDVTKVTMLNATCAAGAGL